MKLWACGFDTVTLRSHRLLTTDLKKQGCSKSQLGLKINGIFKNASSVYVFCNNATNAETSMYDEWETDMADQYYKKCSTVFNQNQTETRQNFTQTRQ